MNVSILPILDHELVPVQFCFLNDKEVTDLKFMAMIKSVAEAIYGHESERKTNELVPVKTSGRKRLVMFSWLSPSQISRLVRAIEEVFPGLESIQIGHGSHLLEHSAGVRPATVEGSTFIQVASCTVELEDGIAHQVEPFEISKAYVSTADFTAFVAATNYETTAQVAGDSENFACHAGQCGVAHDDNVSPVVMVSKIDAEEYCKWANCRLANNCEWLAASVLSWQQLLPGTRPDIVSLWRNNPNALACGWTEWISSTDQNGNALIRTGPRFVLPHDWRTKKNVRACAASFYDLNLSFRVIRNKRQ